jgi:hypothetical protein
MRYIMFLGGTALSLVNLLPMPWRLRLLWLRFLFYLTVKGTLLFPSILGFVEEQNSVYKMGKQQGEGYESLVVLEKVLEHLESEGVSPRRLRQVFEQGEAQGVPPEQLGVFLAQETLGAEHAKQVLGASLYSMRY